MSFHCKYKSTENWYNTLRPKIFFIKFLQIFNTSKVGRLKVVDDNKTHTLHLVRTLYVNDSFAIMISSDQVSCAGEFGHHGFSEVNENDDDDIFF